MPRVVIEVDGFECLRCGHLWVARWPSRIPEDEREGLPPKPKLCARCKSRLWDEPKDKG